MLIVSGTSREKNRRQLSQELRGLRVPLRLKIDGSRLKVESESWAEYWRPCLAFFGADTRLLHRRNRLKRAWLDVLRNPANRQCQLRYCWRYFGLLHHTLRIAREERHRAGAFEALRRIVGFECFTVERAGSPGVAGATVTTRNPVYLVGQLPCDCAPCTPRHVPLLLPPGTDDAFYHYRQLLVGSDIGQSLLIGPAVDLRHRSASFAPIDRLARLVNERPDPYWRPRAKLMARRILRPLLRAAQQEWNGPIGEKVLNILDLGAGTGHMVGKAWQYLARQSEAGGRPRAAFHLIDSSPPSAGRSFGVSRQFGGVAHVEWTTTDFRSLVDDDRWLGTHGPFDWVFICRVFDNTSNFFIEQAEQEPGERTRDCLPHRCLSPRRLPGGIRQLRVSPVRRRIDGGCGMPQFSLQDYFAALRVVQAGSIDAIADEQWYWPVRRFNPASLLTPSGRSLLGQLMRVAKAIVIEDLDLEPEHLTQHRQQFGLIGTAAVHCIRDGFSTEARHYVVTSPQWAGRLPGERLW